MPIRHLVVFLLGFAAYAQAPPLAPPKPAAKSAPNAKAAKPEASPTRAEIAAIMAKLGNFTKLPPLRAVPVIRMTRVQLREFAEKRLAEATTPAEIAREELILKKFGLLPADYNLREGVLKLVTEQAAALYDERLRRMVLLDAMPQLSAADAMGMEQVTIAHELSHALADQHFPLEAYTRPKGKKLTDDETLARTAVVEGQATWLMIEFTLEKAGQSLKTNSFMLDLMGRMASSGAAASGLDKAPLYLREQMIFPYTVGAKFQQAVIAKEGVGAFGSVYRQPPLSTREIIHPEVYLERRTSAAVPPAVELGAWPEMTKRGFTRTADGSFGEFDHLILFLEFEVAKEKDLAAEWRAGAFDLWESGALSALRYRTVWATDSAAQDAMAAYRKAIGEKWRNVVDTEQTDLRIIGTGTEGSFELVRDGKEISVTEIPVIPSK